jgi:hypothetical protein
MKITELIARLEEILRTDGDLVVTCWPYDGQGRFSELDEVDVRELSPEMIFAGSGDKRPERIVNFDA